MVYLLAEWLVASKAFYLAERTVVWTVEKSVGYLENRKVAYLVVILVEWKDELWVDGKAELKEL